MFKSLQNYHSQDATPEGNPVSLTYLQNDLSVHWGDT